MYKGANGLNLTEANYVVLLEPIVSIGVEQQAIGRVHRLGQTRRSHVVRLIVDDTIETQLHAARAEAKKGPAMLGGKEASKEKMHVNELRRLFSE